MKNWELLGVALAILWAFYMGYVMAISFGVIAFSWSVRDVILHFPDGGMTGDLFMSLFRYARWAFIILTACLMLYIPIAMNEAKK